MYEVTEEIECVYQAYKYVWSHGIMSFVNK